MRLDADELAALLRANSFVAIERPPQLWSLETADLESFVRLVGELLATGLARNGADLSTITLSAAHVVADDDAGPMPAGEHVAISVRGPGSWPDGVWPRDPGFLTDDIRTALTAAHAAAAYSRDLGPDGGAVTALFPRSV